MIGSEAQAKQWLRGLDGCDEQAFDRLEKFAELLADENRVQNLVSAGSLPMMWQRHIADSAQLSQLVPRETNAWLDLGTGAGFPGLIIAILNTQVQVALVESRARRVEWLARVADVLNLDNVRLLGERLEHIPSEAFDAISARAFAPLPRLVELAARFSTKQTTWLLPKGRSGPQELSQLTGWHHTFHVEQSLTDADASVIVGTLIGRDRHR